MRSRPVRNAVTALVACAALATTLPATADTGSVHDPWDPGTLDISAISQGHAGDGFVVHRVEFRERFAKRLLVHRLELYLEGRRGATFPFESHIPLVYGRTLRDDDHIFMRFYYYDVEMVTHRLADVRLRKHPHAAAVVIPTSLVSTTTPFTYRWVARTVYTPEGEPTVDDQTPWLWHRIIA